MVTPARLQQQTVAQLFTVSILCRSARLSPAIETWKLNPAVERSPLESFKEEKSGEQKLVFAPFRLAAVGLLTAAAGVSSRKSVVFQAPFAQ
jgi:hypothetical protein